MFGSKRKVAERLMLSAKNLLYENVEQEQPTVKVKFISFISLKLFVVSFDLGRYYITPKKTKK
jgi:hypothetical protein